MGVKGFFKGYIKTIFYVDETNPVERETAERTTAGTTLSREGWNPEYKWKVVLVAGSRRYSGT